MLRKNLDYGTYDEVQFSKFTDKSINLDIIGSDLLTIELALLRVSNEGNKWLQHRAKDVLGRIHKKISDLSSL